MLTCEVCKDRLFDLVYGLLEGDELQETQAHVEACAGCQAALAKVKTSHKIIARAAKAISHVPEFHIPTPESEAPTVVAPPELSAKPKKKRAAWQRPWVAWVIVASLLVAVLTPIIWYREQVRVYQQDVAEARKAFRAIDLEVATLHAKYRPALDAAATRAREQADPYLHVVGPKTLEPSAKGQLEITTRHPDGALASGTLRIKRTFETDKGPVVTVVRVPTEGQARVEFESAGAKPNSVMTLLIEAETKQGVSRLSETVQVPAPSYVARIDTSKLLYPSKDVLFFRVLVLDRVTLQPPGKAIALHVTLMHDNKVIRSLQRNTGPGGILAAEFAVEESFPEGSYALEVHPVDAAQANVQTATARVEIVRDLPGIRLDEQRYARGQSVTGELMLPGNLPAPKEIVGRLDGKPIPITLAPAPQPASAPGAGGFGGGGVNAPQYGKGAKGGGKPMPADQGRFRFSTAPIPPTAGSGGSDQARLIVPIPDMKQELDAVIPLEPTDFAIDFFPEGGDLIAGVRNRVFYRVKSKSGASVTGEGQVILLTGKNDVVDSTYQLGMGYFDFTPDPKETYFVRITTPAKVENIPAPFARLGIRTTGVVLQVCDPCDEHAPKAVGKQADPIHVTLRRQGPALNVLLVAHCRGQIIDQRWVELRKDPIDVTLQPAADVQGMIRVTAFEVLGGGLEPIAERLVYRAPTQRLDLKFTPDRARALPSERRTAKIEALDEAGKPASGWLLASVVDERFQTKPQSLSAHFLLFNEIRGGADLDDASILVRESPKSLEVLELFLGTQGWRRYVTAQAPVQAGAGRGKVTPLVFSTENMPLETLNKRQQDKIDAAVFEVRKKELAEEQQLLADRHRFEAAVNVLVAKAQDFESQVQLWLRLSLGIVLSGFLLAGLILMGIGTYRIIRRRKSPTPAVLSAFGCLAACLVLFLGGRLLGPIEGSPADAVNVGRADQPKGPQVANNAIAKKPAAAPLAATYPTGEFPLRAGRLELQKQDAARGPEKTAAEIDRRNNERVAQTEVVLRAMRERDPSAGLRSGFVHPSGNKSLEDWRIQAIQQSNTAPAPPPAKNDGKKKGKPSVRQLEYPYQPAPNLIGDILLWHPNLFLLNGTAEVHFDIAPVEATYRVLLLGHSPTGRFGFHEMRLDVPTALSR